jgi:hypothetical protein
MLERRTKIFVLIFLILGLFAILILPGKTKTDFPTMPTKYTQAPIRKVDVTLAQDQHDQLFEQLRRFADKHAFTIRISQIDPSGDNFLVQMRRDDIDIKAFDSGDPGLFKIGFYNVNLENPISTLVVNNLIIDLKEFIAKIPNTTFTVKE